jgi:hypothetical protein
MSKGGDMKDCLISIIAGFTFVAFSLGIVHLLDRFGASVALVWFLSAVLHYMLFGVVMIINLTKEDLL